MEIKSLYLDRYRNIDNSIGVLKGSRLYVERIPEPEKKTKSGIILASDEHHKSPLGLGANVPQFFIVLQVGEGYTDADGDIKPGSMDAKVGDVVVLPRLAVQPFSMLPFLNDYKPDSIGTTTEGDIIQNFGPIENVAKYYELLNKEKES